MQDPCSGVGHSSGVSLLQCGLPHGPWSSRSTSHVHVSHSIPFHIHFPMSLSFFLLCLFPLTAVASSEAQVRQDVSSPGCSVVAWLFPQASEPSGAARGRLSHRALCSLLLPKLASLHLMQMHVLLLCNVK